MDDIQKQLINIYNEVTVNTLVANLKESLMLQARLDLMERLHKQKVEEVNMAVAQINELQLKLDDRPTHEDYNELKENLKAMIESKDRTIAEMSDGFSAKIKSLNELISMMESKGIPIPPAPKLKKRKLAAVKVEEAPTKFVDDVIDQDTQGQTFLTIIDTKDGGSF